MVGFVSCSKDEGDNISHKELQGTWVMDRYADYIVETGDLLGHGTGEPNLVLNNDNTCHQSCYCNSARVALSLHVSDLELLERGHHSI